MRLLICARGSHKELGWSNLTLITSIMVRVHFLQNEGTVVNFSRARGCNTRFYKSPN